MAPTREHLVNYMTQSGMHGSYVEGSVLDQLFGPQRQSARSASQLLMEANHQNIPIYTITKANINTILPILNVSDEVISDIIHAINAGQQAIVPEQELIHGNWKGTGYIIQDPLTGGGAYLLEGGYNGGGHEICFESVKPPTTPIAALNAATQQQIAETFTVFLSTYMSIVEKASELLLESEQAKEKMKTAFRLLETTITQIVTETLATPIGCLRIKTNDTATEEFYIAFEIDEETKTYKESVTVDFTSEIPDNCQEPVIWDFGNGDTTNELNPTRTYTKTGKYEVTLTATCRTSGGGSTSEQVKVDVYIIKVELQINNTSVENDDVVRIKSDIAGKRYIVPARIRAIGILSQDITVILTNPDNRLRFPNVNDTIKRLTLPKSGEWVAFEFSGENRSATKDDAIIEVHCDSFTGLVCATENATVFYFEPSSIVITPDGNYGIVKETFTERFTITDNRVAIYLDGNTNLKPTGLDCDPEQVKQFEYLFVGPVQNVEHSKDILTYSSPKIKWHSGVSSGTSVTVPSMMHVIKSIITQPVNDATNGTIGQGISLYSPPALLQCEKTRFIRSDDTPSISITRYVTIDAITDSGSMVGTVSYSFLKVTTDISFRDWTVVLYWNWEDDNDDDYDEVVPLRETIWTLNIDSSAVESQKAISAGIDWEPTKMPALRPPFANKVANDPLNQTIEYSPNTITFTR